MIGANITMKSGSFWATAVYVSNDQKVHCFFFHHLVLFLVDSAYLVLMWDWTAMGS